MNVYEPFHKELRAAHELLCEKLSNINVDNPTILNRLYGNDRQLRLQVAFSKVFRLLEELGEEYDELEEAVLKQEKRND